MGVKRIMETFFAGMQDQSMSGFGGRIVNTPMGPFRWNDTMQLWENVNNGMIMNNISFQDSMMMMDYASYDGGSAPITTTVINVPNSFLSINFAGATLGSIFGVIRNSSSYEVETNNILTEIGTNTPKYILGSNYSNKGILVEKGATNYLLYSNSFTNNIPVVNGGWTGISSTMVVDNSVSNPDDTVGAMKLTATAKTFVAGARSGMTASGITANQYWAFSAWVKAGNVSTASLYVLGVTDLVNYNGQIGIPCNVKILSGPGVVVPSPNKDEPHWKAIENLSTTEWTNVEWTCSSPIEDAYIANGGSKANFKFIAPNIYISTYRGDSVQRVEIGNYIYIWGAQYENGPYSTSLIKTENAITFRQPDRVLDNNIQNDWLNGVCGSFVVEFDRRNDNYGTEGSFVRTIIATGITANKHIYVGYTSGSTYGIFGWFNGSTLIPGLVQGNNKFAFSYLRGETGQITASLNGNNATVYTIGNISELGCGTNWLTIGARVAYTGTAFVNAASLTGFTDTTVKSLKYWNYPLTAAELKQAST